MLRRLLAATALSIAAMPAAAAVDLNEDEFRLYCGFLDASAKPEFQKLKEKDRDAKIAKLAKVKPAVLQAAVAKGSAAGSTCEAIHTQVNTELKAALDKALPGRITFYELDATDPTHVLVRVSWLGIDKKKLVEEASLVASTVIANAPMTKTIALRGVDPTAADKTAETAGWFDAKISGLNARRIDAPKIWEYAATRYRRLFDGIVER
jgi:hypothetical protein